MSSVDTLILAEREGDPLHLMVLAELDLPTGSYAVLTEHEAFNTHGPIPIYVTRVEGELRTGGPLLSVSDEEHSAVRHAWNVWFSSIEVAAA